MHLTTSNLCAGRFLNHRYCLAQVADLGKIYAVLAWDEK